MHRMYIAMWGVLCLAAALASAAAQDVPAARPAGVRIVSVDPLDRIREEADLPQAAEVQITRPRIPK